MLGKAIRKAVLPILLASLMVGTGCRIAYGKADIPLNERAENFTSDNTAASPAKSSEYYKDYDINPDFRCVGEWYTENG